MKRKSKNNLLEELKSLPYFSKERICQLGKNEKSYNLKNSTLNTYISRFLKDKEIIPLKRGLYVSTHFYNSNKNNLSYSFFLANIIKKPSYISSWTALQYYNLATEIIHTTISVTPKVTRTYKTKIGTFSYQSLKKELDEAIIKVAESQYFILGPEVSGMEKEFCNYLGCKHALGVSSGTDALLLALMAIDIKPDDEVIVPTYSFFATAGVVSRLNATPVLVENDPVTFNMDPKDFEKKITPRTKAVIPVHLYGQSADMDEIVSIAKANKIIVIVITILPNNVSKTGAI